MRYLRPQRVMLFALGFGLLLSACPEPDPEGEDAGGGGRDAGLSDVNCDAGVADATGSDQAGADALRPDGAAPDTLSRDALGLDALRPDSALPDSLLADADNFDAGLTPDSTQPWDAAGTDATGIDSATADAASADTAGTDAAAADSGQPDAAQPDSALPDTSLPDIVLPDVGTDPFLQVLSPNGGEQLRVGFPREITWASANLSSAVNLTYSKDGFQGSQYIAQDEPDDGSYLWTVPDDVSATVQVMVSTVSGPLVFDMSDATFEILTTSIELLTPTAGEQLTPFGSVEITWTSSNIPGLVKLEYSHDGFAAEVIEIVAATANDGSFVWDPLPDTSPDSVQLRISAVDAPAVFDLSDPFSVQHWITLTTPVGGESWGVGIAQQITWDSSGLRGDVYLEYSKDNFAADVHIISPGVMNTGALIWDPVPRDLSDTVRVKAGFFDHPTIYDVSPDVFTLREGGWVQQWDDEFGTFVPQLDVDSLGSAVTARLGTGPDQNYAMLVEKTDLWRDEVWARSISGPLGPLALVVDSADNIYVVGYVALNNTVDFDPGSGTEIRVMSADDFFLLKLDSQGDFVWVVRGAAPIKATSAAAFGSDWIAVGGHFHGDTADLSPAATGGELTSNGEDDCFVAVFSASTGALQWSSSWGGIDPDFVNDVAVDSSGNVLVAGSFGGSDVDFDPTHNADLRTPNGARDAFAVRYSAAGGYDDAHTFGWSGFNSVDSIAVDSLDRAYFVGYGWGTAAEELTLASPRDPVILVSNGGNDMLLLRFTAGFAVDAARNFGSVGSDELYDVTVTSSDGLIVAGRSLSDTIDFNPGQPGGEVQDPDWLLVTFTSSLAYRINRALPTPGTYGLNLATHSLGHSYVTMIPDSHGQELAPVHSPCYAVSVPDTTVEHGSYLFKYMPNLCW